MPEGDQHIGSKDHQSLPWVVVDSAPKGLLEFLARLPLSHGCIGGLVLGVVVASLGASWGVIASWGVAGSLLLFVGMNERLVERCYRFIRQTETAKLVEALIKLRQRSRSGDEP